MNHTPAACSLRSAHRGRRNSRPPTVWWETSLTLKEQMNIKHTTQHSTTLRNMKLILVCYMNKARRRNRPWSSAWTLGSPSYDLHVEVKAIQPSWNFALTIMWHTSDDGKCLQYQHSLTSKQTSTISTYTVFFKPADLRTVTLHTATSIRKVEKSIYRP